MQNAAKMTITSKTWTSSLIDQRLIVERGTVKFRNNILTLPYQDERGEEKGQESTKAPTLLHGARREALPWPSLQSQRKGNSRLRPLADKFLLRSQAAGEARLTMKIRHPLATQAAEVSCCFTDLSLAATSPPWAALGSPREVQGQGKSPAEPAGTGRLHSRWLNHVPMQLSHHHEDGPPHCSILPQPGSKMLPGQPLQGDLAVDKQQLHGGHVLFIPNKHTLYRSEVKDFIIPWIFPKR